ncbi:MAG: hydrolase [Alphaproteobacteria bacterium]|jgi:pimeloyl-ACP methyl ester carboxylesterase|nr:hydrolase [Alphaproteobacteria bacterium]
MAELALPETRYARSGDVNIAYQVLEQLGDGERRDLLYVPGMVSHVEFFHELPGYTDFLRRLSCFARVTTFDKRGQGLSDRISGAPPLEVRMDDVRAVLDAVGVEQATVFGVSEGCAMSALFAATYPQRVTHLVLVSGFARFTSAPDYPHMWSYEQIAKSIPYWGSGVSIRIFGAAFAQDPANQKMWARGERLCVSPGGYRELLETNAQIDVRAILPQLAVPTLVLHRSQDKAVQAANGRYLAEHIPGAKYIEYEGVDHMPFHGNVEQLCADVEFFVTGTRRQDESLDRVLATVLFTDIVDSTTRLADVGDAAWRSLLDRYESGARKLVEQHRGRLVKTTGDGVLASFDGPARAIRCAQALRTLAGQTGVATRAGVHTGEIELRGEDVGGMAVHVAARVMAQAGANGIAVSRVVTDLVGGSGLNFAGAREVTLKGVPGNWQIFDVVD